MAEKFDAIVIGSGQAGNPLSHNLADRGWKVALIERDHLGGSCVNYGCTPTKTMVASAQSAHDARRAPDLGVDTGTVAVDLPRIVARKNEVVQVWREGQQEKVASRPTLTLVRGVASFAGPHQVRVGDKTLTADKIFINTGTRSRIPPIPGLEETPYLTNRTILDLTEIPEHLLILGSGYIGLEFGQMFRRFGSEVTIIDKSSQIMPREDEEVAAALRAVLEKEGIHFHLSSNITHVAGDRGRLRLTVETGDGESSETITGSHLLVAVGRQPNTDDLCPEAAGIEMEKGWISVNEFLETNVAGHYALGDVKGGPAFTHISYDDFQILYHNLFHDEKRSTEGRIVPYALYTDPELGRVGMTEKAARDAGYNLKIGCIPMSNVARAIERGETAGLMKVVINADTDRILGAAILSTSGGELVQTLMALMMADAPWTLFRKAIFIHPTLTEGFFALMDSVE